MIIKGVIFDLDGALIDTEGIHYLAWVKALKPLGLNFSKADKIFKNLKETIKYIKVKSIC